MTKKLTPIHPGEQLNQEFMIPLELSSNALARALDVTPARINEIVRGRRGISADTALRLARFFRTSHQFWLNLQANYDVPKIRPVPRLPKLNRVKRLRKPGTPRAARARGG